MLSILCCSLCVLIEVMLFVVTDYNESPMLSYILIAVFSLVFLSASVVEYFQPFVTCCCDEKLMRRPDYCLLIVPVQDSVFTARQHSLLC